MMNKVFAFMKTDNVLKALIRKARCKTMAKRILENNLILYILFNDEIGQCIYTVFNEITGTVQTFYNKKELQNKIGVQV